MDSLEVTYFSSRDGEQPGTSPDNLFSDEPSFTWHGFLIQRLPDSEELGVIVISVIASRVSYYWQVQFLGKMMWGAAVGCLVVSVERKHVLHLEKHRELFPREIVLISYTVLPVLGVSVIGKENVVGLIGSSLGGFIPIGKNYKNLQRLLGPPRS